jgi:hypothetical protein
MKLKTAINTAITTPLILTLCNCASIVSDSNYPVTFKSSDEKKVKIEVRNKDNSLVHTGTTPTTTTLKAGGGFKRARYTVATPSRTTTLMASDDGWIWGNLIFGGLIGIIVDGVNGSAYKLPSEMYVD